MQQTYSAIDHLNLVIQCLPQSKTFLEIKFPLAWYFWEQAILIMDVEILQIKPKQIISTKDLVKSVLNLKRDDLSVIGHRL